MTLGEERVQEFSVPDIGVELLTGVASVHVVLLGVLPQGGPPAAKEMAPAEFGLWLQQEVICTRICWEFEKWERGSIKLRAETGEKDMN
jgi:hypothetical protein